jgi:hypothetical protein
MHADTVDSETLSVLPNPIPGQIFPNLATDPELISSKQFDAFKWQNSLLITQLNRYPGTVPTLCPRKCSGSVSFWASRIC